jgi:FMN phosphatase YigB (HAD superfamily)
MNDAIVLSGVKAVFFDLDGTLRHNLPNGGEVFNEQALHLGLNLSDEDRLRAARWEHFYFASSPELIKDQQSYNEDPEAFWLNFAARRLTAMGCPPTKVEEFGAVISVYMRDSYKPVVHVPSDAIPALVSLKEAGLTLGMVSNRQRSYGDELAQIGLKELFEFSLAGGEIAAYKPEPQIFHKALEMAGTTAEQSVYVGDNYFADVIGARGAGLRPVLYDPEGVFPDADCEVIRSFQELPDLLRTG